MKKRAFAALLWTYATWYACNVLGSFASVALPGALIGLAVGALVIALPILRSQHDAAGIVSTSSAVPAEG
jgi:putative effector of murein hydrolase LrgA (UPF0299 family)